MHRQFRLTNAFKKILSQIFATLQRIPILAIFIPSGLKLAELAKRRGRVGDVTAILTTLPHF